MHVSERLRVHANVLAGDVDAFPERHDGRVLTQHERVGTLARLDSGVDFAL